ncbi:SynChlorMet cassette protein ScmD [candidate division KSB1 bacterium]|nr:SynChlorMet cassette protein ScmD [candidate division KSB1 bacterium]
MKETGKPTANPMLVLREEFDDWAILFDPDTGDAHALNPISVFVWKRLDGHHSVDDIMSELVKSCDDVPENAQTEVIKFIDELLEQGYAGYEI